ncbi:phosphotransferase [Cellulomonas sp. DKR-3]|uniref:Phosphotransferase n=1 Tax=Cellulomonas fulva TaxID=2835530 RepID=A0ABS5TXS5_9CELL|nr:aminoglycoside phosphotransferase family protein [Cellulomonas fulva]MBT0993960.1 phosphotransferase [Cellulomonas fulva]
MTTLLDEPAALAVLTSPDVGDLLGAALATVGDRLAAGSSWRVDAVHHRPGDGVSVGYAVSTAAGRQEYLLASSSRSCPRDVPGTLVARGPAGEVVVWRHPQDPLLPALGRACDPALLAPALPGAGPVTALRLVGYRPLRRAVVRAERDGVTWFVKVLRPADGNAADVVARHRLLAAAGVPVPPVARADDDGLVVLHALPGVPLLDAVVAGRAPALADVLAVVGAFPEAVRDLPVRRPWSARARAYGDALAVRPALGERARAVAASVRSGLRRTDAGPVVATHGDLHEGQLLVDDAGRPTGLLDVDTAGPGRLVDDVACLLAHLRAVSPPTREVEATAARWSAEAGAFVDPDALRVRVAGVLLSLAAGALPVGPSTAPDEAERLLAAAEGALG